MALVRCPDCGKEASTQAAACPGCGRVMGTAKRKQSAGLAVIAGTVLVIGGMLYLIAAGSGYGLLTMLAGFFVFVAGRVLKS